MRRRLIIVVGVLAFLAVSALLARWLTTENRENAAILALVRDEARGDAAAVIARLDGCAADPTCVSQARRATAAVQRPGTPKILNLSSGTAYALGESTGRSRVAWAVVDQGLPVVQCVTVRRTGNALVGREVHLLRVSLPIAGQGSC